MDLLKSMALAFSCFTRLPMPRVEWDKANMRFLLAWLPLVGAVVGCIVAAWCLLADALGLNAVLKAAGIALLPVAVTGGFHLDGFCDVVDAQSSHADPIRKREILKDSHIGAFAAMAVSAYLIAYFAVATELPGGWRPAALLVCLHVMTRCGSGLASTLFWGNGADGMLTSFRDSADVRLTTGIVVVFAVAACICAAVVSPLCALVMIIAEAVLLIWLNGFARRNFGGMSGDIAGFFLQTCEIVLVVCVMIVSKAVGL